MAISKRLITAFLSVAMLCALVSCGTLKRISSQTSFEYFDTYATLTAYSYSDEEFDEYYSVFISELARLHKLLDVYNEYDGLVNLCTLNKQAHSAPVKVSRELYSFIEHALKVSEAAQGYVSLTMGALTQIWKQAIAQKTPPEKDAIDEAAAHVSADACVLDKSALTVYFEDGGLLLDAGAFAKGYAADIIADALIDAGCESFLLDLGGNVTARGQKSTGEPWKAGVAPAADADTSGISVPLPRHTLSTSASYHRGFEKDGRLYHHVISPFTHYPENVFASVSVLSEDGFLADALSTALFSMSLEDGMALIDSLDGTEAMWIDANGKITYSDGFLKN